MLSVVHYPSFGGPHNQVLRLAKPLRERGYATLAVVPNEPGNAFDRLRAAGIDVVRMRLGRIRARLDWSVQRQMAATLAGDVPRLMRLMRREHVDLVVVHGLVNPQAAVAARLTGRPVVWQVLDTRTPRPLRVALAPLVRVLASSVMTTGRGVAEAHAGLPRDSGRLFSYFPPVDTTLFALDPEDRQAVRASLGLAPDDVVVGCVANLTPQKGLESFVEVARSLSAARPDVRFALFGSPTTSHEGYAARLVASADDLRARGRLLVRDVGADVARHVRALDVFLATAGPRSEGISTTILEAMSSGVPVVSTDVGAIREALVDGADGFLVAHDDHDALVEQVALLAEDPGLRERLGTSARERAVRCFDVERCADVHAEAFRAALGRSRT